MNEAGCSCEVPPRRGRLRGLSSLLPALAVAAIPKCPLCWAASMAVFGAAGVSVPYRWLLPAAAVLLAAGLVLLWTGRHRWGAGPFALGLAGTALLLAGRLALGGPAAVWTAWAGAALVAAGSLWSALPRRGRPLP